MSSAFILPVNCEEIEVLMTRWRLDSWLLPAVVCKRGSFHLITLDSTHCCKA